MLVLSIFLSTHDARGFKGLNIVRRGTRNMFGLGDILLRGGLPKERKLKRPDWENYNDHGDQINVPLKPLYTILLLRQQESLD